MNTKFLVTFFKPLVSFISWIGVAVAGIAVILSAIGFLVIRGHHDLLGITGVVPMPAENWSVEGARFVYNSLSYFWGGLWSLWGLLIAGLFAGVGLLVFMTYKRWALKSHLRRAIVIFVSFLLLGLMTNFFARHGKPTHLLVKEQGYENEIAHRADEKEVRQLRAQYALLLAMLAAAVIWLQQLPRALDIKFIHEKKTLSIPPKPSPTEEASGKGQSSESEASNPTPKVEETMTLAKFSCWHILILGLWLFFLVPLLYLPTNYGKMAKENTFLKVRLIRTLDSTQPQDGSKGTKTVSSYEGWLLYEDSNRIVLYEGSSGQEPINIFTRKDFAHIQILDSNNIFAVQQFNDN